MNYASTGNPGAKSHAVIAFSAVCQYPSISCHLQYRCPDFHRGYSAV